MTIALSTLWAIVVVIVFIGILHELELALIDEERNRARKAKRRAALDEIERVNFIHPHERVDWDDLTRQIALYQ